MRDLDDGQPFVISDGVTDPALSETDKASISGGLGLNAMIRPPCIGAGAAR